MTIIQDVQNKTKLLDKLNELDDVQGNMMRELTDGVPLKEDATKVKDGFKGVEKSLNNEILDNSYNATLLLDKMIKYLGAWYGN